MKPLMTEKVHLDTRQPQPAIYTNLEGIPKLNPNTVAVVRDAQLWKETGKLKYKRTEMRLGAGMIVTAIQPAVCSKAAPAVRSSGDRPAIPLT